MVNKVGIVFIVIGLGLFTFYCAQQMLELPLPVIVKVAIICGIVGFALLLANYLIATWRSRDKYEEVDQ